MPKTHINIEISFANQGLTHYGGLHLLQQFFQRIKLRSALTQSIRFQQLNNRYSVSDSILAIVYPIILGLGRIETNILLQQNGVFQHLASLPTYPNPTTLRRFLDRFGSRGLTAFQNLHDRFRNHYLGKPDPLSSIIFDLDTKVLTVYGQQQGARVGFNPKKRGRPSYQPLLCFEGKTGDIWEGVYLSGDIHPAPHTIEILEKSVSKLPSGIREIRVRADSAFYDHTIAEYLQELPAFYAIVARITKPIQRYFAGLSYEEISPGIWLAEFEYKPWRWKATQRFIVIRRLVPEKPSWQLSLFKMTGYTYHVIVTNLSLKPLNLWRFYNQRATGELIIRELLEAYTLGKIPTRDWACNQAYFQLVLFAYNLINWFKRLCLPDDWQQLNLQTVRNRLLVVPAQLLRAQGKRILSLPNSYPYSATFMQILKNINELPRENYS
jgi:Transposase DDE domain group 1